MNEAQDVIFVRGGEHVSRVTCTYMSIDLKDLASTTVDCFLCKPFWCFGAEMGVNEVLT